MKRVLAIIVTLFSGFVFAQTNTQQRVIPQTSAFARAMLTNETANGIALSLGVANAVTNNQTAVNFGTANATHFTGTDLTLGTAQLSHNGAGQFVLANPVITSIANGDGDATIYPDAEYLFDRQTGQATLNWNTRTLTHGGTNVVDWQNRDLAPGFTIGGVPIGSTSTTNWTIKFTNQPAGFVLTNFPTVILGTNGVDLSGVTNLVQSATNSLTASTNGEYKLFAITFKSGRQFADDTQGGEESGHYITSTDGVKWEGATGQPDFPGPLRNGGLIKYKNLFAFGYSAHTALQHKTNAALTISTNLLNWPWSTNLSFALSGEYLNITNTFVWVSTKPLIIVTNPTSTNIWFTACVGTNSTNIITQPTTFVQRIVTCDYNTFPYSGWTVASNIVNATGYTNMIDLNFWEEGGVIYGIYKDENATRQRIGRFMSRSPTAPFTNVVNDPFGMDYVEGANAFWTPNGKVGMLATLYQFGTGLYSGNRDGNRVVYAVADSITNTFSSFTNIQISGMSAQGFGPVLLATLPDSQLADAATAPAQIAGDFVIPPRYGARFSGRTVGGMSDVTNDYSVMLFGDRTEHEGGTGVTTNGVVVDFVRDNSSTSSDVPPLAYWRAKAIVERYESGGLGYWNSRPGISLSLGGRQNSRHTSTTYNGLFISNALSGIISDPASQGLVFGVNMARSDSPAQWVLQDTTKPGWFMEGWSTSGGGFGLWNTMPTAGNAGSFRQVWFADTNNVMYGNFTGLTQTNAVLESPRVVKSFSVGGPLPYSSINSNFNGMFYSNALAGFVGDPTANARGTILLNNLVPRQSGGWYLQDTNANGWMMEMIGDSANDGLYIWRAAKGTTNQVTFTQVLNINSNGVVFANVTGLPQTNLFLRTPTITGPSTNSGDFIQNGGSVTISVNSTNSGNALQSGSLTVSGKSTNSNDFIQTGGSVTVSVAQTNSSVGYVMNTNGASAVGRFGMLSGFPTLFADTTAAARWGTTFFNLGVSQLGLGSATSPTYYLSYTSPRLSFWGSGATPTVSLVASNYEATGLGVFTNGVLSKAQISTAALTALNWASNNVYAGRVRIASGNQTYTLTNSIVTANSVAFATVNSDDATAVSCKAIPSSGLLTLKLNGVAAADCDVSWNIESP